MLPNGWTATEIGNLATFKSGGTPSKANPDYWGGDYPWISGKDLKQHYLSSSIDTLTKNGFESTNVAPIGSSLVLVRGMTLLKDFPVGFATRALAFNQDIKALIPNKDVDGLFLSYLLVAHKEEIQQLVSTAGHGTGRLETERIRSFPVKVPAVLEQKKIAQILSTWDQAIATTERLLDLARQQKKALMQQLLTGKKRLLDKNGIRFGGEWGKATLKDLVEVIYGKSPKEVINEAGTIPIYGTGGIGGYASEFLCSEVSVLIGRKGTIDKPIYIDEPFWAIDTTFYCLSKKNINLKWFFYLISNVNLKVYSEASGVPSLSRETLNSIKLLVTPYLEEQQEIAAVLSAADQEISTLQSQLDGLKQEKKALMQQLLTGKRRVQCALDEAEV